MDNKPIKCFLVQAIYGSALKEDEDKTWSPHACIVKYVRLDTNEEKANWHDFGPGAMIRACWLPKNINWDNETEPHLYVICPNGHVWDIDSRASNCGSPNDRLHRCWIRHGVPPNITVDKNGQTCSAGAGSIQCGDYHGFLRNGELT